MNTIINCRVCKNDNLKDIIHLGEQYITSRFPVYGDFSIPKMNIDLCLCENCNLVQLKQIIDQDDLYKHEYGYLSGISNTMRTHLQNYQQEVLTVVHSLKPGDIIIDIGSNDATTLKYYSPEYRRLGIDPTGEQFKQYYTDGIELIPDYFTLSNFQKKYGTEQKVKIISSICMFYDLPDPITFCNEIYGLLEDDGIWTCEQSYLLTMLKRNSIDTICHEHLEYYSLTTIKYIADICNLKIINISLNDSNGGSFRLYLCKKECDTYNEATDMINSLFQEEIDYGINKVSTYLQFVKNCDEQVRLLKKGIDMINSNGKNVYIYGASTKGNCLLQYAKIFENDAKYAIERNENKVGKMTNTGIEIIGEKTMRENPPNYLLVLPYHFKNEIIEREQEFLKNGGQLIFPLPKLEIVSCYKKVLITGCDGYLAKYVKDKYIEAKNYSIYGIGRTMTPFEKNITKINFDMNDGDKLEETILIIKPDLIVHLAGISSTQKAFENPMLALDTNGRIISNLCSIIHKHKLPTRVFNASSSEIYKGNKEYLIKEDDRNHILNYSHPYAVGNIMGNSMVDFYRKNHECVFSNGIIFTAESKLKNNTYLLNKVGQHIKNWENDKTPLQTGNLFSYRNIIHPIDVANAIFIILGQENGDTYNICNEESIKVIDLVFIMYKKRGIYLYEKNKTLYDTKTNNPVIIMNDKYKYGDQSIVNIQGNAFKLKGLGWKPTKSIDDILSEILEV